MASWISLFLIDQLTMKKKSSLAFTEFPTASYKDWVELAKKELKGAELSSLEWVLGNSLTLKPYYTKQDIAHPPLPELIPMFHGNPIEKGDWIVYHRVKVRNYPESRQEAKQILEGDDGVIFDWNETIDLRALLEGINLTGKSIGFISKQKDSGLINQYHAHIKHSKCQPQSCFFQLPDAINPSSTPGIFTVVESLYIDDPVLRIVELLRSLIHRYSEVEQKQVKKLSKSTIFLIEPGLNFFAGIASVQALRWLLHYFYKGYGCKIDPGQFYFIGRSQFWNEPEYEPHGNLIKSTCSVMSLALGGCQGIMVDSDSISQEENRAAALISAILKEESYFNKVNNPVCGTYFLDHLIRTIVSTVWDRITSEVEA